MRRKWFIWLGGGALAIGPANAQQPQIALNGLRACQATADPGARLACFDREAEVLAGAAARGDLVVASRDDIRRSRRSLFGISLPSGGLPRGFAGEDVAPAEITATVAALQPLENGRYRLTTTEGAVWETTESNLLPPRRAKEVTISRGVLGGYFVEVKGGRSVRARRVR